jgi:NAD(P)-dependent dehydrogenase (short-subunit alcohol dehydrogenase family)
MQAVYAAAKGGIVSMTLPLARDLAPGRDPGRDYRARHLPHARLPRRGPGAARRLLACGGPFPKRMGRADEYAKLATHIAENVHLNGEAIRLDGALRFTPRGPGSGADTSMQLI